MNSNFQVIILTFIVYINCTISTPGIETIDYKILTSNDVPRGFIDGKHCNRLCNNEKLNCFFNFEIENFYSMSKACYNCSNVLSDCFRQDCVVGGGIARTVTVVNRQLPGPSVEVCKGDKVMVLVQNKLIDGVTAIHWHGHHMENSKYMDGVPWVTQCPIVGGNNFTYEFPADYYGTMWWHSHTEMQRGDGVFGAFIVRRRLEDDPQSKLYDFDLSEHVIQIGDWTDHLNIEVFQAFTLGGQRIEVPGILVNGLGYQPDKNSKTLLSNFNVTQGFRYRFRLIHVGFYDCPIEVSIDGHAMFIISSDSRDLEPFEVQSFGLSAGERFDFVLNANQSIGSYFMRFKGYLQCSFLKTFTTAVLRYNGSNDMFPVGDFPNYDTSAPTGGVIFNPVSIKNATGYTKVIGIHDVKSLEALDKSLNTTNVKKFYVTLDMSSVDNPDKNRPFFYGFNQVDYKYQSRTPQLNHITYNKLYDVPLLPGRFKIDLKQSCTEETMRDKNCTTNFCSCPVIYQVSKNDILEFVFMELWNQDRSAVLHPMHLHGYAFRVLGWGEIGRNITKEHVIRLDQQGKLIRNFNKPPVKDTVTVPKGGYTIVRFKASNTGFWLFHCHLDIHSVEGMQLAIKVGTNNQMPKIPKNFPQCSSWPKK